MLYTSMKQAYQFFMDNDDESKDIVIQEIADELSLFFRTTFIVAQENQELEATLARLEIRKQDLDDEVKVLSNSSRDLCQV